MNNEQDLDQKAIDDLLATANKELTGHSPESETTEPPEASITQDLIAPTQIIPTQIAVLPNKVNNTTLFFNKLIQYLIKKKWFTISILFVLFIAGGAFLGYKTATHKLTLQTPLEKIINQGITFEEKNFVTYAGYGEKNIVTAFLHAGMSVDALRATDGWSPLISACFYKKPEIVQILLKEHATIDLQDLHGRTALMQATAMGAEDIVIMLLESGANPNIQDKNGRTALMEAYSKKHAVIAEILKNAGADPTISPPKTPINSPQTKPDIVKELQVMTEASPMAEETRLAVGKAGFAQIGMPLEDIQKKYPSITISQKYVDGIKKAIANIYLNGQSTPSLQLELSSSALKIVSTISIDDERFSTDKQITVKSNVGDIRNQYSINDLKEMNNSLFLTVKSMKMLFELDINKSDMSADWVKSTDPASIPNNIKIKRIIIY